MQSQISVCIPNLPAQVLALLMLFTKPYGPNGFPSPCRSPPANIPVCMSHLVTASEFNRFWQPVCRPACSLWYPKSLEYSLVSPILSLPQQTPILHLPRTHPALSLPQTEQRAEWPKTKHLLHLLGQEME